MAQTQMCTNDNFDDSNRTPIMKKRREAPILGTSRFFRLQNVYKNFYSV